MSIKNIEEGQKEIEKYEKIIQDLKQRLLSKFDFIYAPPKAESMIYLVRKVNRFYDRLELALGELKDE